MNQKNEYDEHSASPRQLHELIGVPVRFANGEPAGYVNDVRLAPSQRVRGPLSELVTDGLVIGARKHGTLLGYDRKREQGPLIVRAAVLALHRHSGYVPWTSVSDVDPDGALVRLRVDSLESLEAP